MISKYFACCLSYFTLVPFYIYSNFQNTGGEIIVNIQISLFAKNDRKRI